MNRSLLIPAICCLFAFVGLSAVLHGVAGREAGAELASLGISERPAGTSDANGELPLSTVEAERLLAALAGEYLRPWRQWEASPHRLYSRAAPRPIPTILAKIEVSPNGTTGSGKFLVAKIDVSIGGESKPTPCVVDRTTREVLLFADGQWLAQVEWLKSAPLP